MHCWKIQRKKGTSFLGNFVILREKIKKYIRKIGYAGGKWILPSLMRNKYFFQAIKDMMWGGITRTLTPLLYKLIPSNKMAATIEKTFKNNPMHLSISLWYPLHCVNNLAKVLQFWKWMIFYFYNNK